MMCLLLCICALMYVVCVHAVLCPMRATRARCTWGPWCVTSPLHMSPTVYGCASYNFGVPTYRSCRFLLAGWHAGKQQRLSTDGCCELFSCRVLRSPDVNSKCGGLLAVACAVAWDGCCMGQWLRPLSAPPHLAYAWTNMKCLALFTLHDGKEGCGTVDCILCHGCMFVLPMVRHMCRSTC